MAASSNAAHFRAMMDRTIAFLERKAAAEAKRPPTPSLWEQYYSPAVIVGHLIKMLGDTGVEVSECNSCGWLTCPDELIEHTETQRKICRGCELREVGIAIPDPTIENTSEDAQQ